MSHTGMAASIRGPLTVTEQGDRRVREEGDDVVAARFQAGDDEALAVAYQRWSPLIYTSAMRATGNPADAADITQAVFVGAWRGRHGFAYQRQKTQRRDRGHRNQKQTSVRAGHKKPAIIDALHASHNR